jgi:hypothetical protein
MARRKSILFCADCCEYTIFEYIHRRHASSPDGHEDWHCETCGGCEYDVINRVIRIEPPKSWTDVRQ